MAFITEILPAFADNYIYLVGDTELGLAMVVDPGDPDVVRKALKKNDWHLTLILNTHHHNDHIGGNIKLKREYGAAIIAPDKERARIKDMDRGVVQGDSVTFSDIKAKVIETPGHTSGGIAFYFAGLNALFCGDTLFSLGCGRLFEGSPNEMWQSLCKLRELPDETQVYCGHEYTEANARFALMLDEDNPDLKARISDVRKKRQQGHATLPVSLATEKKTNPFLRADNKGFQQALSKSGLPAGTDPIAVFAALRAAKDRFS
ncbi:MAG: hydroxyacylglutathione hydrolase [Alphaproteobacteria bacterium]|nr:hydroxyacylglutathione hydrolase [Alphaproteobacteria bacterium]